MLKNTNDTYGTVAKALHWLMAIAIIMMLIMGYFLEDLKSPEYYKAHKAIGFILLLLAILRLIWRIVNPVPKYDTSMPKIMALLAHLGHYTLYLLMIIMPLSAFIASNAAFRPVSFLYLFDMDSIFSEKNLELAKNMMNIHRFLAVIFIVVIGAHFLAALYHHYVRKDNVLKRILP